MSWLSEKSDEGAIVPALQYDKLSVSSTFCNKFQSLWKKRTLTGSFRRRLLKHFEFQNKLLLTFLFFARSGIIFLDVVV